jgi:hypothetical protein
MKDRKSQVTEEGMAWLAKTYGKDSLDCFVAGAEFADEHPIEHLCEGIKQDLTERLMDLHHDHRIMKAALEFCVKSYGQGITQEIVYGEITAALSQLRCK